MWLDVHHKSMDRLAIIFNPRSGTGKAPLLADALVDRFRRDGVETTAQSVLEPLVDPVETVIVIGGDGTARSVAESVRHWPVTPKLLFLPRGTANLLDIHFHLDWPHAGVVDAVIDALRVSRTIDLDLALANGQAMLLMCSVGFDAGVVHDLAAGRTGPITKLHYVRPTVRRFLDFKTPPLTVEIDGRTVWREQPATVLVANVREYGTGFPLAPHAKSNDGLLDVTILPTRNRLDLLKFSAAGILRRLHRAGAKFHRGKHVHVTGDAPVQVDGDAFGHLPVTVELPGRTQPFIVRPRETH